MAKKTLIKKDNALINAAYTLTLAEQRLILLAVADAAGQPELLKSITIRADQYAEQFNTTRQTAYEALKDAASQLFERRFSFQEETQKGLKTIVSRWVSHIAYIEGGAVIEIAFAPHVEPLLCDLKDKFSYYEIEQVSELTSVYAIRLYELLISWRSTGKTPAYELNDFRKHLGVESEEYSRMTDFKRWVLDAAVKQINKYTDIKVEYDQHKQGRTITGFSFNFSIKKQAEKETKAIKSKGKKLITKAAAAKLARAGETYDELYLRLDSEYIIRG